MKNSNDTFGNRARGLAVCSIVPQPAAPPRAPFKKCKGEGKGKVIPLQAR